MKILILGNDGYIGKPLQGYLSQFYNVFGIDNFIRRNTCKSVIPVQNVEQYAVDVCNYKDVAHVIQNYKPDTIIHLAEQPSAAWSMNGLEQCIETHRNNVFGTLNVLYAIKEYAPEAHLIKLGSMGEYGTPSEIIQELPEQPKYPGSWYHCTKVHDTHNIQFACRNWGLSCTDIMQGVVYGVEAYGFKTRLDIDECFGTAINRFCAAAVVGEKLPIYGDGEQRRSFLPLEDTLQCIKLIVEHPHNGYRVVHQYDKVYTMNELFRIINEIVPCKATHKFNPRNEKEHLYFPEAHLLKIFGYKPKSDTQGVIKTIIGECEKYKDRINPELLKPKIIW